jgi:hypothetical protein
MQCVHGICWLLLPASAFPQDMQKSSNSDATANKNLQGPALLQLPACWCAALWCPHLSTFESSCDALLSSFICTRYMVKCGPLAGVMRCAVKLFCLRVAAPHVIDAVGSRSAASSMVAVQVSSAKHCLASGDACLPQRTEAYCKHFHTHLIALTSRMY